MTEVSKIAGDSLGYFAGLLEIHLKNVKALCAAQRKLLDDLGEWQARIPRQFSRLSQRLLEKPLASSETSDMPALIIDAIKDSINASQENSGLLTEILKDNQVALQTRMNKALDELRTLIAQAIPSAMPPTRPPEQAAPEKQTPSSA
jgi:hypothetical protein